MATSEHSEDRIFKVPVPVVLDPGVSAAALAAAWRPLALPASAKDKLAGAVDGLLTPRECRQLIEFSESLKYQDLRDAYNPRYRKGERVLVMDEVWAEALFQQRVKPLLEHVLRPRGGVFTMQHSRRYGAAVAPTAANSMLRFLRYGPGGHFAPHSDASYTCPHTGRSTGITVSIALADVEDGAGGATEFGEESRREFEATDSVQQRAGRAIVFQHDIVHRGQELTRGAKYLLRLDVYCEQQAPLEFF